MIEYVSSHGFSEFFLTFETLYQCGVRLVRGVVKEVHPKKLVLSDESEVPYGLLVWSTGVGPSEFVKSLNLPKSQGGRYTIKCNSHTVRMCLNLEFVEGYREGKEKERKPEIHDPRICGAIYGGKVKVEGQHEDKKLDLFFDFPIIFPFP